MNETSRMRSLPIEGSPLVEWLFEGNGKDAEVRITTADGRRFAFGVSEPRLHVHVQGRVHAEVASLDDLTLRVRYSAPRLHLTEAKIRYPGHDSEWQGDLDRFEKGRLMSWAMSEARFTLTGEDAS